MLNPDFREFIQSLNANHVRYLVVGGYPGVEFESCYASRVEVETEGVVVNFIDLDNLKKSKQAAGRLQDLADLENLE